MTNANVSNHLQENRGKIGPWDVAELCELAAALAEIRTAVLSLVGLHGDGLHADDEMIEQVRHAMIELTKGLCGTVVSGKRDVATELSQSFFFITRAVTSSGEMPIVDYPNSSVPAPKEPPIIVSQITSESATTPDGRQIDLALLAVGFYEPGQRTSAHEYTDAVVIRRDRSTGERRFRHFMYEPSEPEGLNFQRATELRLAWLGRAESVFVVQQPSETPPAS